MTVYIAKRLGGKNGPRWHVRYQAGRYHQSVHLGAFASEREAKLRRRWALDELAAGREPDRARITSAEASTRTVRSAAAAWLATRIDLAESTLRGYTIKTRGIATDEIGGLDPRRVSEADVQAWIGRLANRYEPGTVSQWLNVLRQVLDHAGARPNPCREPSLRLPRRRRSEIRLPTTAELAALYDAMPVEYRPIMLLMERGGLRISEACALEGRDVHPGRILVRSGKTRSARRWVDSLAHPHGDLELDTLERPRGDGRLWYVTTSQVRNAMEARCKRLGIPKVRPHDCRHLHASRMLHSHLLSPAELAARLGHASPAITLSVYTHVVPPLS